MSDFRQRLRSIGRRERLVASATGTAWLGVTAALWLGLSAGWIALWGAGAISVFSLVMISAVAAVALLWKAVPRLVWRSFAPERMALDLERTFPDFDSRLISALQLEHQPVESPEFRAQLLESAAAVFNRLDPRRAFSRKMLWIAALTLVVLAPTLGFFAKRHPEILWSGPRAIWQRSWWRNLRATVSSVGMAEWALADVQLRMTYPAYTGLAPTAAENTDGTIRAVKGTHVQWSAVSSQPLAQANVRLADVTRLPLTLDASRRRLSGEIVVMESQNYVIEGKAASGGGLQSKAYVMEVVPDEYPRIALDAPSDAQEVDEVGGVDIAYQIDDDFGVSRVVIRVENAADEILMQNFSPAVKTAKGRYHWDIKGLTLKPGETLRFVVRVYDNDTVSGPKYTDAAAKSLRRVSRQAVRQDLLARQEVILDELVQSLGDQLEWSATMWSEMNETKRKRAQAVEARLSGLAKSVAEVQAKFKAVSKTGDAAAESSSPLMLSALAQLETTLGEILKSWQTLSAQPYQEAFARKQSEHNVEQLEQTVLSFERLLHGQRVENLIDSSQSMKDQLSRLDDALKNASKGDLSAAQKQLQAFEKEYQDFMKRAAQAIDAMPAEEFFNADALKELERQSPNATLEKIRRLLEAGDLEGARREMENLKNQMSEMQRNLDSSTDKRRDEMAGKVQSSMKNLDDLINGQKKVLQETEKVEQEVQARQEAAQQDVLKKFLEKQQQRLRDIRRLVRNWREDIQRDPAAKALLMFSESLDNDLDEGLSGLERAFQRQDLESALPLADENLGVLERLANNAKAILRFSGSNDAQTTKRLKPLHEAQTIAQAIVDDLQALQSQRRPPMSGAQSKRLEELQGAQQGLRKRALEFSEQLKALSKDVPALKPEMLGEEKGEERMPEMKRAAGELEKRAVPEAIAQERSALYRLQDAKQKMQKALQDLQNRPLGLSRRPQSGGGSESSGNSVQEHVEIPGAEKYQVPENFRQEIMDAMKKPAPKNYEKLNRDYYERLVR